MNRLEKLNPQSPLSPEEASFLLKPDTISSLQLPSQKHVQFYYYLLVNLLICFPNQQLQALQWASNLKLPAEWIEAATLLSSKYVQSLSQSSSPLSPSPPPAPTSTQPSTSVSSEIPASISQKGALMAQAYKAQGKSEVQFISASDSGSRYFRFLFQKPPSTSFASLTTRLEDVLSHAGFDPSIEYISRNLPNNLFELQIPKPRELWKSLHLIDSLLPPELIQKLSQVPDKNKAFTQAIEYLSRFLESTYGIHSSLSQNGIYLPFGFTLEGNLFNLSLTSGTLIVGQPDAGKSVGLLQLATSFCLSRLPAHGKLVFLDFKDGLTFASFDSCPHLFTNPATKKPLLPVSPGPHINAVEEALDVMRLLHSEFESRTAQFREAKVQSLWEYNLKFPENPIPPILIFVEEILRFYSLATAQGKDKEFEQLFLDAATLWRCAGMPLILSTQYAKSSTGLPPEVRGSLGSVIAYRCTESAAKLAFGDNDTGWARAVSRLMLKSGDCIVKHDSTFSHVQSFNLSSSTLSHVLESLETQYF